MMGSKIMPFKLEQLPGEPIIITSVDPDDRSLESARAFEQQLTALLDDQLKPVFLVNVLPEDYEFSMDELLEATQIITAQSHLYQHRNIKGIAAVTTSEALKIAYRGLSNEAFGNIYVEAFSTLDAALDYARSHT